MAAIPQTVFSVSVNEKFYVLIKILLKFFPESPIDNSQALV